MAAPASGRIGTYGSRSLAQLRAEIRRRADMPLGDSYVDPIEFFENGEDAFDTADEFMAAVRACFTSTPREVVGDVELNEYINASLGELYDLLISHYGEDYFVADPWEFVADGTADLIPLPVDFAKCLGIDVRTSSGCWTRVDPFNFGERNRYSLEARSGVTPSILDTNAHYRIRDNGIWIEPTPAAGTVFRLHYVPMMPRVVDVGIVDIGISDYDLPFTVTINGEQVACDPFGDPAGEILSALTPEASVDAFDVGRENVEYNPEGQGYVFRVTVTPGVGDVIYWSADRYVDGGVEYESPVTLEPSNVVWSGYTSSRLSQWLEYVVVDCVIKCKAKEESDVSLEMAQKAALIDRVEKMASNRDLGGPKTVTDTSSYYWPFGRGW